MLVLLQGALTQWIERQAARRFYPLKLLGFIPLLTFAFQPPHVGTLQTYARGGEATPFPRPSAGRSRTRSPTSSTRPRATSPR